MLRVTLNTHNVPHKDRSFILNSCRRTCETCAKIRRFSVQLLHSRSSFRGMNATIQSAQVQLSRDVRGWAIRCIPSILSIIPRDLHRRGHVELGHVQRACDMRNAISGIFRKTDRTDLVLSASLFMQYNSFCNKIYCARNILFSSKKNSENNKYAFQNNIMLSSCPIYISGL